MKPIGMINCFLDWADPTQVGQIVRQQLQPTQLLLFLLSLQLVVKQGLEEQVHNQTRGQ